MPDLDELRLKLRDAQQEARNLAVMAMDPSLSAEKREIIKELERSARAEAALRLAALDLALGRLSKKPPTILE
jgi:hypothetical protein